MNAANEVTLGLNNCGFFSGTDMVSALPHLDVTRMKQTILQLE